MSAPSRKRQRAAREHLANLEAQRVVEALRTPEVERDPVIDAAVAFQPARPHRGPAFRQNRRRTAEPVTVSWLPGHGPNGRDAA